MQSLDQEVMANYSPSSNLPFLSKVLEKVISAQLLHHFYKHNLLRIIYICFHFLLFAADQGSPSLLTHLDLLATFGWGDLTILLHCLQYILWHHSGVVVPYGTSPYVPYHLYAWTFMDSLVTTMLMTHSSFFPLVKQQYRTKCFVIHMFLFFRNTCIRFFNKFQL